MGEYSKKIGEVGESIVEVILRLIGWGAAQSRVDIECSFPNKHKTSSQDRRTHGVDFFHSMKSPLLGDVVDHLVISAKCTADPYPPMPTKKFKDHFHELAMTMECVRRSKLRQEANARFSGVTKARDIGVLFWITLDRASYTDIVDKVVTCRDLTDARFETIYVVDNERAQFLMDTYAFARRICSGSRIEFFYPDSGQNMSPRNRQSEGSALPIEFLTSAVLPLRLVSADDSKKLILSTRDPFSRDSVQRLLDMAHRLTQGWAKNAVLTFRDYQKHIHSNDVQAAKAAFADQSFVPCVAVECLEDDFRSVSNE